MKTWTDHLLERASEDAAEPPMDEEERENAVVDYRLRFCQLCGTPKFRPRWDDTRPLICAGCGAQYGGVA